MPTITLARSSSAYTTRTEPKKNKGNNPARLLLSSHATSAKDAYLTFAVPKEVLDPRNSVESAVLRVHWATKNYHSTGAAGYYYEMRATRILQGWSAGKLTWNNRPDVGGTTTIVAKTSSQVGPNARYDLNAKPFIDAWRGGATNFGIRVRGAQEFWIALANTGAAAPRLIITYHVPPGLPTTVSPANNDVVSVAKPLLTVVGAETSASGLTAVQVQLSRTSNWAAPTWDSGVVASKAAMLDLADFPGAPSVADGEEMYWRIRLRGTGNMWSGWSAGARFRRKAMGTLVITSPGEPPNNTVSDPTPPLAWELTGATQSAYRVILRRLGSTGKSISTIWDSGIVASLDNTMSPPDSVTVSRNAGGRYEYELRVWDTEPRAVSGGVPAYVSATREFTYAYSGTIAPVSDLTAENLDPKPFVRLRWTRNETPDRYIIDRDGETVAVIDGPNAETDTPEVFEWVDLLASPRTPHEWTVRCVVNGVTSAANPTVWEQNDAGGIWLSDPENDVYIVMLDPTLESAYSEDGETHKPLAGTPIRVTTDLNGASGRVVGELLKTPLTEDATGTDLFRNFLAVRAAYSGRRMILSMNDLAIPVIAFDMTASHTPAPGKDGDYIYTASFSFFEVS